MVTVDWIGMMMTTTTTRSKSKKIPLVLIWLFILSTFSPTITSFSLDVNNIRKRPYAPLPRRQPGVSFSLRDPTVQEDEDAGDTTIIIDDNVFIHALETSLNALVAQPHEARRVLHGRGGMYGADWDHVTLDWYPPVWLWTTFRAEDPATTAWIVDAVQKFSMRSNITEFNFVHQDRAQNATNLVLRGCVPQPHVVMEHGNAFTINLMHSQNTGIFLDAAVARQWAQAASADKRVLNLFAYTCGFSLAALRGHASEVVNVDMSKGALRTGQRNHDLNGLSLNARFLGHDVFKTWGKIKKLGPYDLIICDPPSYQKGSFVAKKGDYAKVIRRIPSLLEPGGQTLLCLNAPELGTDFLLDLVAVEAPELQYCCRLENPETFPAMDPERSLKVLLFQLKD